MSSKFVLTCFKRKNDKSGDSFVNSYGISHSEWDLLKEDATLISLGCKFQLIEYDDIRVLENGYNTKVDKSLYIDVRYDDKFDTCQVYRGMLLASHIAAFVIEFVKRYNVITPTSTSLVVHKDPNESTTLVTESSQGTVIVSPTPEPSFVRSWKLPVAIVGGIMFLFLISAGIVFFDWRRRKGSTLQNMTPFFLSEVPERSHNVDFSSLKARKLLEEEGDL
jgi:hypothetical protein